METIGARKQNLENQLDQAEASERFNLFLEKIQKETAYNVEEVMIANLDTNVAGDFNRENKRVRADEQLVDKSIAANDMNFLGHVIHHEFAHKKFEKQSGGVSIVDNDINEAATEVVAGEESGQRPQTYAPERLKLKKLETVSGKNIVALFKEGKSTEINEIIAANDENYAQAA